MTWQILIRALKEHEGACLVLVSCVVMGFAWLRVLWGYANDARRVAPVRWYTGYVPPEFALPNRWRLQELNRDYRPGGRARRPDL